MNYFARKAIALSSRFRSNRLVQFRDTLRPTPDDRILDVGGLPGTWIGSGIEPQVTLLNLEFPKDRPAPFTWNEGDACDLRRYADAEFDIVFSNSVIEHVGDRPRQEAMAREIRRTGKSYWVQTPNRHFPIEAHFMFPFFQYMPRTVRRFIARVWPFSFAKIYGMDAIHEADHIWLLDARTLRELFPDATILRERLLGMTKSLVAFRKR